MSRHIPFQSLRQPEREVSQERLREILARRSVITHRAEVMNPPESAAQGSEARNLNTAQRHGSGVEPQGSAAQATPNSATPLEWSKPVNHGGGSAMVHDTTGRFRIDILGSKVTAHYTCWRLAEGSGALNERLGMVWSADEARAMCEAHSARQV